MTRPGFKVVVEPVAIVFVWLASTLFAAGAVAAPDVADSLPRSFTDQWCVHQTPHFKLLTDLRKRSALRTVNELHRFRQLFLALFPNASADASVPLTILIFRRTRDFIAMTGTARYAGVTLPSIHEFRLLAIHGHRRVPTENALHEYAHYLLRTRTDLNYPLWYEEGLATYLATAKLSRNSAQLGGPPYREIRPVARDPAVSFKATVAATSILDLTGAELAAFYGKAWLLTHFIRLGHEAGFPDWRAALVRYLESPARNFSNTFGFTPEQAGELLTDYLKHRPLPRESVALPGGDPSIGGTAAGGNANRAEQPVTKNRTGQPRTRGTTDAARAPTCLSDADRDYELALSILTLNQPVAVAALERLPKTARTLTALSQAYWHDRKRAQALVEEALSHQAADPEANVRLAHLLVRDCHFSSDSACIGKWVEAAERYRNVLRDHPGRYDAVYGLGIAYLHTGRAAEAMRQLRQAYEKMPWEVRINYFLGEGYRIANDPRAEIHLKNARNWAIDENWRARAEFALRRLRNRE